MNRQMTDARYLVLTGNYGSGKTEIALNLAFRAAESMQTTLVDLDIVNPYFRSGEKAEELREAGIRTLMPTFALTTVDIPALPAEIQSVFETPSERVIFDVGGDDTGAAALGRYYPSFMARREETSVWMVVNCMRPLTQTAEDITELAERIQSRGRLALDGLINNTNLAGRTTEEMLREGEEILLRCGKSMGLPVMTAGQPEVLAAGRWRTDTLEIRRYMKPEWMEE